MTLVSNVPLALTAVALSLGFYYEDGDISKSVRGVWEQDDRGSLVGRGGNFSDQRSEEPHLVATVSVLQVF